jgi:copper(I)-binding protein
MIARLEFAMKRRALFLLSLVLLPPIRLRLVQPAVAADYKLGALEISHTWARATAPTAPSGGGFATITNSGTMPDRLVSASSPAAAQVQVHEMKMEGNIMRMREVEGGLSIAPGATVTLAPGSYHLMLMGLKGPLKQGTSVPVTLVFEKAGKIEIELAVAAMGAMGGGQGR